MNLGNEDQAHSARQEDSAIPGLTGEQFRDLLSHVNKLKGPMENLLGMKSLPDGITWILDTSASRC